MISQETSLNIDLSVDSDNSDYSSDSSTSTDTLSDDETESEHEYVEIKPDVEIVEVRPDTRSQIIDDLAWSLTCEIVVGQALLLCLDVFGEAFDFLGQPRHLGGFIGSVAIGDAQIKRRS